MAQGTVDIANRFGVNEWFQFVGQAVTHDVAEAATGASGDPPIFLDGLPFPIGRTPYEGGTGPGDPRQQINEETSFLDLSFIYGNNQARLDLARADMSAGSGVQSAKLLLGPDGLLPTIREVATDAGTTSLAVLSAMRPDGFGGLPDPAGSPPPASFENLFYAGDNRVNQTGALISTHVVWAREHNYQVEKLTPHAQSHGWTQDQLFEAARAITEAEWQHVVFDEYLPKLLGENALSQYAGYRSTVDPRAINEWATVAFRFGHDQSSNDLVGLNEDGSNRFTTTLGQAFTLAAAAQNVPGAAHSAEDIAAWIRGLTARHSQQIDGKVADGNRNLLFGGVGGQVTDLEAFDIQRGRDHGVWDYNKLREGLGLSTYKSFDHFGAANHLESSRLQALKAVYGNDIGKLDAIVGGLLEKKYYDSQLGETFTKLNVLQFEALRDGDALYFEHRLAGQPELVKEIMHTSFAEIIQRNTAVDHIYHDAFAAHNRISEADGTLDGTKTKDLLIGSARHDMIKARDGDDDVYGGYGKDHVSGGNGSDLIYGEADDDKLSGEKGADKISAGAGNDDAFGGDGDDYVSGDGGRDRVFGDKGDDVVRGGIGNDQVWGGAGHDTCYGDGGNDMLFGGAGWDVFVFKASSGKDVIADFKVRDDKIALGDYGFENLAEVQQAAHQTAKGVVVELDAYGNEVLLLGVKLASLSDTNFVYEEKYGDAAMPTMPFEDDLLI
jgi:Ca2+-binding RTX toxin-like protein